MRCVGASIGDRGRGLFTDLDFFNFIAGFPSCTPPYSLILSSALDIELRRDCGLVEGLQRV